jgi:hypothetical protein
LAAPCRIEDSEEKVSLRTPNKTWRLLYFQRDTWSISSFSSDLISIKEIQIRSAGH